MTKETRQKIKDSKRIVIKIGTSTIMYQNGAINLQQVEKLSFVLSDLRNREKKSSSFRQGLSVSVCPV